MQASVQFRLYVAGEAPHSRRAVHNLEAFCEAHLARPHPIEIIDLFATPDRALADGILMTPTLVATKGEATRRIVGDLGDLSITSVLLDLVSDGPSPP